MGTRKKMPEGMIRERVLGEVLKEMPECFGDETEIQEVRYLLEKFQKAEDDKLMELSRILRQKIENSPLEDEVDKFSYTDSSEKYLEQNRAVDDTLIGYLKNKKEAVKASIEEKKKRDDKLRKESWEQISCLLKLFRIRCLMECREEIMELIETPVPEPEPDPILRVNIGDGKILEKWAEKNEAERNVPERNVAERNEVERNEAERNVAERNVAERNEAERNGAERDVVERNGAERNGVERNGAERNEVERNGAERNEVERNGAERNEAERNGVEKNEVERNVVIKNRIAENGVTENSATRNDAADNTAAVRRWLIRAAKEGSINGSEISEVKQATPNISLHNFNVAVFCSLLERQDLGYVTEESPGKWKIRNRSELVRILKVRDETVSRRTGGNGPEDPILNGELWNYICSREGEDSDILADFISAEKDVFDNHSFIEQFFDSETGAPFWKTLERQVHDTFLRAVSGAKGSVLENRCQQIILQVQGLLLNKEGINAVKRRYNRVCRWNHTIDVKHEKARKALSGYEEQLKILCDYTYGIRAGYSAAEAEKVFTMLKETMAEINETDPGELTKIGELLEQLFQLEHSLQQLKEDLCHMEQSEELEEKAIFRLWEERNLANLSLDELDDLIKTSGSISEKQMLEQMKTVLIDLGKQNWGNELNELPKKVREGFIEQYKSALYRKGRELVASGLFARELEKLKKG